MKTPTYTIHELQTDTASGLSYRIRQPAPVKPTKCLVLLHCVGGNETNLIERIAQTNG